MQYEWLWCDIYLIQTIHKIEQNNNYSIHNGECFLNVR